MFRSLTLTLALPHSRPLSLPVCQKFFKEHNATDGIKLDFIPYEFDVPGTYPASGTDWTDYCKSYGEQKAKYLLEEKLPRAFQLGKEIGIDFQIDRRIVHTPTVNNALILAQQHSVALPFALRMLTLHFEQKLDPNDKNLLAAELETAGVPKSPIDQMLAESAEIHDQRNRSIAFPSSQLE